MKQLAGRVRLLGYFKLRSDDTTVFCCFVQYLLHECWITSKCCPGTVVVAQKARSRCRDAKVKDEGRNWLFFLHEKKKKQNITLHFLGKGFNKIIWFIMPNFSGTIFNRTFVLPIVYIMCTRCNETTKWCNCMIFRKSKCWRCFLCCFSCFAGTALSALPQVLISMLFLCLGGPCNEGPTLAQPEEWCP